MSAHPYKTAPQKAFWSKAISKGFNPDGIVSGQPILRKGDTVVSAGSCFASNLVPYLEKSGFKYIRTEPRNPAFSNEAPENLGYANFSAAYGNIYTVRQLLQLLRRTNGTFKPKEDRWHTDGKVIDPFRPGLRFAARSDAEFDILTQQHLVNTRRAFAAAKVFVLTLGLTEAWVSRLDGAVFPACPGTVSGEFDAARHAFHNFSVSEASEDLETFIREVREINPSLRFILTVSPVPLVATATDQHVIRASTYSKSVLRVAAEQVANSTPNVTYFPAYEIVTGPQAPKNFFAPDRRNVTTDAVDLVMSIFLAACETGTEVPVAIPQDDEGDKLSQVVEVECEELMADR